MKKISVYSNGLTMATDVLDENGEKNCLIVSTNGAWWQRYKEVEFENCDETF